MKKIFLILILSLSIISPVYAQTRQEFASGLAEVFNLQSDTKREMTGLYYYSDWLQIDKQYRAAVSACAQSGLFMPERGPYQPNAQVTSDDALLAANGLDKLILPSSEYIKVLGVVMAKSSSGLTIKTDDGIMLNCQVDTPFINDKGLTDCSGLTEGTLIALCVDKKDRIVLLWGQKTNDYELVAIRRATLYLFDDPRFMFVMTEPTQFRFGEWNPLGKKYDDLVILDNARIIMNWKDVSRNEINTDWLDKKVNYVVGRNPLDDGKLKILHIEFE